MKTPVTPLVPCSRTAEGLYGKLEFLHPSGSVKHRAIPELLRDKRLRDELPEGRRVVIHSAGAAAITTAWVGARMGCPVDAILPSSASRGVERKLRWLGAETHRLSSREAPDHLRRFEAEGAFCLTTQNPSKQNESEWIDPYRQIAAEILTEVAEPQAIVAGVGTGAMITGIARELRSRGSTCQVIGVEPQECRLEGEGAVWRPHRIPGLAPPFGAPLLDRDAIDEFVGVPSTIAWDRARLCAREEGWGVCPASGASLEAAATLCHERGWSRVVAILSGSIDVHLDTAPEWDESRDVVHRERDHAHVR